jgi:hypothetical protein
LSLVSLHEADSAPGRLFIVAQPRRSISRCFRPARFRATANLSGCGDVAFSTLKPCGNDRLCADTHAPSSSCPGSGARLCEISHVITFTRLWYVNCFLRDAAEQHPVEFKSKAKRASIRR